MLPALQELKDIKFKCVIAGKDRGNLLENYLTVKMSHFLVKGHLPIEELEGLRLPEEGISMEDVEKKLIFEALARTNGHILRASKLLGMTYKTLQYRIKKYDINV